MQYFTHHGFLRAHVRVCVCNMVATVDFSRFLMFFRNDSTRFDDCANHLQLQLDHMSVVTSAAIHEVSQHTEHILQHLDACAARVRDDMRSVLHQDDARVLDALFGIGVYAAQLGVSWRMWHLHTSVEDLLDCITVPVHARSFSVPRDIDTHAHAFGMPKAMKEDNNYWWSHDDGQTIEVAFASDTPFRAEAVELCVLHNKRLDWHFVRAGPKTLTFTVYVPPVGYTACNLKICGIHIARLHFLRPYPPDCD